MKCMSRFIRFPILITVIFIIHIIITWPLTSSDAFFSPVIAFAKSASAIFSLSLNSAISSCRDCISLWSQTKWNMFSVFAILCIIWVLEQYTVSPQIMHPTRWNKIQISTLWVWLVCIGNYYFHKWSRHQCFSHVLNKISSRLAMTS